MAGSDNGLKQSVLSGNETLAQSIALIAPTAAPLLTIPLVYVSAGAGTWLAFVISTFTIVLVALNVNQFARITCSPGSLYCYISSHLNPIWGLLAAWALLIAYIGTAVAIAGGLTNYLIVLLKNLFGIQPFPLIVAPVGILLAAGFAYRDVTISTRLMLALEVASVSLISVVFIGVLIQHEFRPDVGQFTLQGVTPDKLRMGLVLAIFCSVGFESATSLGSEAQEPLRTIPRAVMWSGILAGLFFIFCAYTEVLGFSGESVTLDKSLAPMHVLAQKAGLPNVVGLLIDFGALISFFSCMLACITAGARVLFLMGQKGALHSLLGQAHTANKTPHLAVVASSLAVFLPVSVLCSSGMSPFEVYGLAGTLATFGFLAAYILVSVAAPIFLRAQGRLTASAVITSVLAVLAIGVVFVGCIYPIPAPPYSFLPYIFVGLLLGGLGWSILRNAGTVVFTENTAKALDPTPD